MAQTQDPEKPQTFEKNLERLDLIVRQLESAELPLEKAIQFYEEGMKLAEICHKQLEEAEGKVEILRKRAGGRMTPEPFGTEAPESA